MLGLAAAMWLLKAMCLVPFGALPWLFQGLCLNCSAQKQRHTHFPLSALNFNYVLHTESSVYLPLHHPFPHNIFNEQKNSILVWPSIVHLQVNQSAYVLSKTVCHGASSPFWSETKRQHNRTAQMLFSFRIPPGESPSATRLNIIPPVCPGSVWGQAAMPATPSKWDTHGNLYQVPEPVTSTGSSQWDTDLLINSPCRLPCTESQSVQC